MRRTIFYGWVIVAVTAVVLLATAGVRAAPGAFLLSMQDEPGWSTSALSFAAAVGLLTYGLAGPVSGRLMASFGIRGVTMLSLLVTAGGADLLGVRPRDLAGDGLLRVPVRARQRPGRERPRADDRQPLVHQGPWARRRRVRGQRQRRSAHLLPVPHDPGGHVRLAGRGDRHGGHRAAPADPGLPLAPGRPG